MSTAPIPYDDVALEVGAPRAADDATYRKQIAALSPRANGQEVVWPADKAATKLKYPAR